MVLAATSSVPVSASSSNDGSAPSTATGNLPVTTATNPVVTTAANNHGVDANGSPNPSGEDSSLIDNTLATLLNLPPDIDLLALLDEPSLFNQFQQTNPQTFADSSFPLNPLHGTFVRQYDSRRGWEHLVAFVRGTFDRELAIRLCKSVARFRPSILSVAMTLSDSDLSLVERSLSRMLVEIQKHIEVSGTPTVVWRRTGEILAVGKEFSILTNWPVTTDFQNRFIYEFFDPSSCVDFWERFSTAVFDSSTNSWACSCVLLRPDGSGIRCMVHIAIKRDVFDVPMCIVGSFLPILDAPTTQYPTRISTTLGASQTLNPNSSSSNGTVNGSTQSHLQPRGTQPQTQQQQLNTNHTLSMGNSVISTTQCGPPISTTARTEGPAVVA